MHLPYQNNCFFSLREKKIDHEFSSRNYTLFWSTQVHLQHWMYTDEAAFQYYQWKSIRNFLQNSQAILIGPKFHFENFPSQYLRMQLFLQFESMFEIAMPWLLFHVSLFSLLKFSYYVSDIHWVTWYSTSQWKHNLKEWFYANSTFFCRLEFNACLCIGIRIYWYVLRAYMCVCIYYEFITQRMLTWQLIIVSFAMDKHHVRSFYIWMRIMIKKRMFVIKNGFRKIT